MTSLRIMLIEDDSIIAQFLGDLLVSMGHEVCAVANNEADAAIVAARSKPDLMIVDAQLADGSGVAAVAQILSSGFVPHIFMTGDRYLLERMKPEAIVLRKPFNSHDLQRAIVRSRPAPVLPRPVRSE